MTTYNADVVSYPSQQCGFHHLDYGAFEELAVPDLSWVANTESRYASILRKIPDIFAWEDACRDHLANLQVLARSVAISQFRSCLDHISRYDQSLFKAMMTTFVDLPLEGKLRFMTAPETFYRIRRLRKEPVDSIFSLCNYLNGEAAFYGLAPMDKDYVTALGDFYYSESADGHPTAGNGNGHKAPANAVTAPRVGGIPIDFDSPNVADAQETDDPKEYLQYTAEEKALVCKNLNESLNQIERVSPAAADLIRQHIKVIIPLKAVNRSETGSTSQPRFPGRVLLRGVEHGMFGWLASSLVHEAMHQVLYILEWAGPFTLGDFDVKASMVKSGWTGRDLQPHSYIHACFIWYGVSNFWLRARSSDAFDAELVERELAKSMAGFVNENPVERLAACSGMVRFDVLRAASTLFDPYLTFVRSRIDLNEVGHFTQYPFAGRPIDLLFSDFRHGGVSILEILGHFLPSMAPSSSIFIHSAPTFWPSYLLLEHLCSQLNAGKVPQLLQDLCSLDLSEFVRRRRIVLVHLTERKPRKQNSAAWLKIEPVDVLPYPRATMRETPDRVMPKVGDV